MRAICLFWGLVIGLLGGLNQVNGQYWVEFRGENGSGHSDFKNIPTEWSDESENIKWKAPLEGLGWSSPVIAGDRIWLTSSDTEKNQLSVQVLDLESGQPLKSTVVFEKTLGRIHKKNSHASPTAILDGERVYVHFGDHGTAALDLEANVIWKRDLDYGHFHGPGGSPLLVDDKLIISCDGDDAQYLIALNKQTGETIWQVEKKHIHPARIQGGKMMPIAFSTPTLRQVGDVKEAVICGADHIAGFDVETGRERWWASYDGYSVVPRPIFYRDLVYYSSSYNDAVLYALKLGGEGDLTGQIQWQTNRHAPHNPTPLIVEDLLFSVSDRGIAQCLDAATGEVYWTERLGRAYSASPIFVDGKIYFQDETGGTTIIRPARKFEKLAENKITGRTLATPVPIPGGLLIRTDEALLRIDSN